MIRILWSVPLMFAALACRPVEPTRDTAVPFVRSLQSADGGFAPAPGEASSAPATASGLRTLRLLGAEPNDKAAARSYLLSCYKDGVFTTAPGGPSTVASTAVGFLGVMAADVPQAEAARIGAEVNRTLSAQAKTFEEIRIAAAGLEAGSLKTSQAEEWIRIAREHLAPTGTPAQSARAVGGAAACVLRLGGKLVDPAATLKVLVDAQAGDGGWSKDGTGPTHMETTYRVMRSIKMLKGKPRDEAKLRAYLQSCRNLDGGFGTAPGEKSTLSGTYYVTIITSWLDGK